jgi:hypothetical protein
MISAGTLRYGGQQCYRERRCRGEWLDGNTRLGADHIDTLGTVTVDGGGSILGTGTSALTTTGTFEMKNGVVTQSSTELTAAKQNYDRHDRPLRVEYLHRGDAELMPAC